MLVQIFICTIKFEPSILDLFIFTHLLALNWSKFNGIVRQGAPLNLVLCKSLDLRAQGLVRTLLSWVNSGKGPWPSYEINRGTSLVHIFLI
jgi:hypothetical protein